MTSNIVVVEEGLAGFRGDACLVMNEETEEFFIVSTITRAEFAHAYGDIETLAFRSDSGGNVYEWEDVAGGGDMTRADVIAVLASGELNNWDSEDDSYFQHEDVDYLADVKDMYPVEDWDDFAREDPAFD